MNSPEANEAEIERREAEILALQKRAADPSDPYEGHDFERDGRG